MNAESKRPIQIEDLLRLKRAERPAAEFWTEFDRQLRAKQLAAIVGRRPWWQSLPRIVPRFARLSVPLGAAAVLVVTYISVHESRQAAFSAALVLGTAEPVALATSVATMEAATPIEASIAPASNETVAEVTASLASSSVALAVKSQEAEASRIMPLLSVLGTEPGVSEHQTSARLVPTSLVASAAAEPAVSQGLFINSRVSGRPAVEPLQQITPPGERARARLLTAMVSMPSATAPSRPSGGSRAATQLSEENLYDSSHRFGAHGAGMTMKF